MHKVILKGELARIQFHKRHNFFILQKEFPKAKFIAMDTACKYWPWLQKVDKDRSEQQEPLLSVMHAKSHTWTCQVSILNMVY